MNIDEGKTRPKKPNLAEIRKRLLCKRMTEAFTDYHGVESDPNLTLVEKMIKFQKAIDDATRRKVYFASFWGNCHKIVSMNQRKPTRKHWRRLGLRDSGCNVCVHSTNWFFNYNQLQYCMVSLHFIQINFKAIEEICESEPDNWK